jgi:hypothetical protein
LQPESALVLTQQPQVSLQVQPPVPALHPLESLLETQPQVSMSVSRPLA